MSGCFIVHYIIVNVSFYLSTRIKAQAALIEYGCRLVASWRGHGYGEGDGEHILAPEARPRRERSVRPRATGNVSFIIHLHNDTLTDHEYKSCDEQEEFEQYSGTNTEGERCVNIP